jgi:hypothetical protein
MERTNMIKREKTFEVSNEPARADWISMIGDMYRPIHDTTVGKMAMLRFCMLGAPSFRTEEEGRSSIKKIKEASMLSGPKSNVTTSYKILILGAVIGSAIGTTMSEKRNSAYNDPAVPVQVKKTLKMASDADLMMSMELFSCGMGTPVDNTVSFTGNCSLLKGRNYVAGDIGDSFTIKVNIDMVYGRKQAADHTITIRGKVIADKVEEKEPEVVDEVPDLEEESYSDEFRWLLLLFFIKEVDEPHIEEEESLPTQRDRIEVAPAGEDDVPRAQDSTSAKEAAPGGGESETWEVFKAIMIALIMTTMIFAFGSMPWNPGILE